MFLSVYSTFNIYASMGMCVCLYVCDFISMEKNMENA